MKKGQRVLLIFNAILIALLAVDCFVGILNLYTNVLFLVAAFAFLRIYFGFDKSSKNYSKDIILTILIYLLFYYMLAYLSGLILGFLSNGYSLKPLMILKNIFPILSAIILMEIIRHIILNKGSKYTNVVVSTIILFILMDVSLIAHAYNLFKFESGLMFLLKYVLPAISKNLLLTYLVYKSGYKSGILYRVITELTLYILPIFPNFGEYIGVVINFLIPAVLTYLLYINYTKKELANENKSLRRVLIIFVACVCIIQIFFTSGWFKYFTLTVGSGSMEPNLLVGDVIVIEKKNDDEMHDIKVGEILVFKHDNIVVVHRVIKIEGDSNNLIFYTQGDNNDNPDNYPIPQSSVVGTTNLRIPYFGLPVVWLNELLKK